MQPSTQKIVTWITGLIASVIVHYAPGVPPDIATTLSIGILAWVSGYVKQHFAECEQLCPECALERAADRAVALQKTPAPPPASGKGV